MPTKVDTATPAAANNPGGSTDYEDPSSEESGDSLAAREATKQALTFRLNPKTLD